MIILPSTCMQGKKCVDVECGNCLTTAISAISMQGKKCAKRLNVVTVYTNSTSATSVQGKNC